VCVCVCIPVVRISVFKIQDHLRARSRARRNEEATCNLKEQKQRAVSVRQRRLRSQLRLRRVVALANIVMTVDTRSLRPKRKPKNKKGSGHQKRRPVARRMREATRSSKSQRFVERTQFSLFMVRAKERDEYKYLCVCVSHTYMVCY